MDCFSFQSASVTEALLTRWSFTLRSVTGLKSGNLEDLWNPENEVSQGTIKYPGKLLVQRRICVLSWNQTRGSWTRKTRWNAAVNIMSCLVSLILLQFKIKRIFSSVSQKIRWLSVLILQLMHEQVDEDIVQADYTVFYLIRLW